MLLAGVRRHHSFASAGQGIPAQWEEFNRLGTLPHQQGSVAYGALCGGDPATQMMEYMCAVEVSEFDPAHVGRMRVPPQYYAVFEHTAPLSAIRDTWQAIWHHWLPRSGYTPVHGPEFEVYGERFDPRTREGTVEIWTPVQPPAGATM